jgi:hypothetical protein
MLCILCYNAATSIAAPEPTKEDASLRDLSDVMHLTLSDGRVVLRTAVAGTEPDEPQHVTVRGFAGPAEVAVARGEGASATGPVVPAAFHLTAELPGTPGRQANIEVRWDYNALELGRSLRVQEGAEHYVQMVRLAVTPQPRRQRAHLMVTEVGRTPAGRTPAALDVSADTPAALARAHPAAAAQFLRPLLRELRQEHLLAPEDAVTRQVLAAHLPASPAAAKRVGELLPALDSADRDAREGATEQLDALGWEGAIALLQLDRAPLSPEQNVRIDQILASHTPIRLEESARLYSDPEFLMDCFYSPDAATRRAALGRLGAALGGTEIDFDAAEEDEQTRADAVADLRRRLAAPGRQ